MAQVDAGLQGLSLEQLLGLRALLQKVSQRPQNRHPQRSAMPRGLIGLRSAHPTPARPGPRPVVQGGAFDPAQAATLMRANLGGAGLRQAMPAGPYSQVANQPMPSQSALQQIPNYDVQPSVLRGIGAFPRQRRPLRRAIGY